MSQNRTRSTPKSNSTTKPGAGNTSMEELSDISKQMEELTDDLKSVKQDVQMIMKKDDMVTLIKETVNHMMVGMAETFELTVKTQVDAATKHLEVRITGLDVENKQLRNDIFQLKNELKMMKIREGETADRSKMAMSRANYNEQYSRKNNVKILEVKEVATETVESLAKEVCDMVEKQGTVITPDRIVAIHRIPGKPGHPKPVLVKFQNNNEKTKLMKLRKEFKAAGNRLVDDVTRLNAQLITRLLEHPRIDQAWYFNGSVYGKTLADKRYRFDLFDDVDAVLMG